MTLLARSKSAPHSLSRADGPLARRQTNFTPREGQLAFAQAVAEAIQNKETLLGRSRAPAPAKCFAYLVPGAAFGFDGRDFDRQASRCRISFSTKTYRRFRPRSASMCRQPSSKAEATMSVLIGLNGRNPKAFCLSATATASFGRSSGLRRFQPRVTARSFRRCPRTIRSGRW